MIVSLLLFSAVSCFAGQAREVAYGPLPFQTLYVWLPSDGMQGRPGALLVHGGGWTGGDKLYARERCETFAQHGIVAVAANYRLANTEASSTRWPAQLDDAEAALQWMIANACELGLDPHRICVYGESAGGHIAVWLGIEDKRVACVVDGFGPMDLGRLGKKFDAALTALIGNPRDAAAARAASPVYFVPSYLPPTLIIQGETDDLVLPYQSKALYDAMKSKGAPVAMIMYPGGHSWAGLNSASRDSIVLQMVSFIKNAPPRQN